MIVIFYFPDSTTHCSIALTGLDREENAYISFFPGQQRAFRLHTMEEDFKHGITKIVTIPSEESRGFGLSEQGILDWYNKTFSSQSFSLFTNNCAAVTYQALTVGQLTSVSLRHKRILSGNYMLNLPSNLMAYSEQLAQAINAECKSRMAEFFLHDSPITEKIIEFENLYLHRQSMSKQDFLSSLCTKLMSLKVLLANAAAHDVRDMANVQALYAELIARTVSILKECGVATSLVKSLREYYQASEVDSSVFAILIAQLNNAVGDSESMPKKIKSMRHLGIFFLANKPTKKHGYKNKVQTRIDDAHNAHARYFKEEQIGSAQLARLHRPS